jgi:hypothetical protein
MTPDYPRHSPDAFMENATPVQSFVSPALEMGPEELARPRYGRPKRPAGSETPPQPPTASEQAPPTE